MVLTKLSISKVQEKTNEREQVNFLFKPFKKQYPRFSFIQHESKPFLRILRLQSLCCGFVLRTLSLPALSAGLPIL